MSNLALAGAVSGMGAGLRQGLASLQSGMIQHGLQEDQYAREGAERERDRQFQARMQQERQRYAEAEQGKEFAFRRDDTDRQLRSREDIAEKDREVREREAERESTHKSVLEGFAGQKAGVDKMVGEAQAAQMRAHGEYYRAGGRAGFSARLKEAVASDDGMSAQDRKVVTQFISAKIAPLEKQIAEIQGDDMLDDRTKRERIGPLQARIDRYTRHVGEMYGIDLGGGDEAEHRPRVSIDDPFAEAIAPKSVSDAPSVRRGDSPAPSREMSSTLQAYIGRQAGAAEPSSLDAYAARQGRPSYKIPPSLARDRGRDRGYEFPLNFSLLNARRPPQR